MIKSLGLALLLVLTLAVSMVAGASAGTTAGQSIDDAAIISCNLPFGGTLLQGQHAWAKFWPATGRTTGVVMNFSPVPADTAPKNTTYFKVWYNLPTPMGMVLTELGRGTAPGSFTNLKTWRGGSLQGVHYLEIINTNDGPTDFTLYLNCNWPIR